MSCNPVTNFRRKVLLVGLGPTAGTALDSLAERFEIVGLVREYGGEGGEGAEGDPVIRRAHQLGIRVLPVATVAAIEESVERLAPDCVVVSSFHRILPDSLLSKCRFVNVHYAPLPKYRGRANVNWAIINGESSVGISIHEMAPGLDAGNILFQAEIPIGEDDTVGDLYERLNGIQRGALADAVLRFLDGDVGQPQDESRATYCCTRLPDDGQIDWSMSTRRVHDLIRALAAPYPGAFTCFEGRRLIVWRSKPVAAAPRYVGRIPGRVVRVSREAGFVDVLTGDGVLRLLEVQRPGEAVAPAADVIRSVKATLGLRPADLLRRIEELERQVAALSAAATEPKSVARDASETAGVQ
jgi:methionyl-tRNA formyltransferase